MAGMHTIWVRFKTIFATNTVRLCMIIAMSAYGVKQTRRRVVTLRSKGVRNTMHMVTIHSKTTRRQNANMMNSAVVSAQLRKATNTTRCPCANPELFEQT